MDVVSKDPSVVTRARNPQRRTVLHPPRSLWELPNGLELPANVIPFEPQAALVAYVSDFIVVDGAAALLAQARLLDASPHGRRGIARHYVDSGRPDHSYAFGYAFFELLQDARDKRFRGVLVETIARLAPDLTSALKAAMLLMAEGIEIFEVTAGRVVVDPVLAARIRAV